MCVQKKLSFLVCHKDQGGAQSKYQEISPLLLKKKQQNRLQEHFPKGGKKLAPCYPRVAVVTPGHPMDTGLACFVEIDNYRGGKKLHTTKQLRIEIMVRTRKKNKANRTKAEEDHKQCRKQRNLAVKLNKRATRSYCNSLDPLKVGKGDSFSKTVKPLF